MSTSSRTALAALRWPFFSPSAAPLWLAVRLYLAWVWIRFGAAKLRDGWPATNPMEGILEAVAQGHTPALLPPLRQAARALLDAGADPVLATAIPLLEVALGAAFASGVLLAPAALGATLMNLALILSGLAVWTFDGRFVVLQLLLLCAGRAAARAEAELARPRRRPQTAVRWPRRSSPAGARSHR